MTFHRKNVVSVVSLSLSLQWMNVCVDVCCSHSKLWLIRSCRFDFSALRHVANWGTRLLKKLLPFVFLILFFFLILFYIIKIHSPWLGPCFCVLACVYKSLFRFSMFFFSSSCHFAIAVAFIWHSVLWRHTKMRHTEKRIRKCSTCDRVIRESDGKAKRNFVKDVIELLQMKI